MKEYVYHGQIIFNRDIILRPFNIPEKWRYFNTYTKQANAHGGEN